MRFLKRTFNLKTGEMNEAADPSTMSQYNLNSINNESLVNNSVYSGSVPRTAKFDIEE
jgi:hypothetical protein